MGENVQVKVGEVNEAKTEAVVFCDTLGKHHHREFYAAVSFEMLLDQAFHCSSRKLSSREKSNRKDRGQIPCSVIRRRGCSQGTGV